MPPPGYVAGTKSAEAPPSPAAPAPAPVHPADERQRERRAGKPTPAPAPDPGAAAKQAAKAAQDAKEAAMRAAMAPMAAKLDKIAAQRRASNRRSRSREAKERKPSPARAPAAAAATAATSLGSWGQRLAAALACLLLGAELLRLATEPPAGTVLPGLPDPVGELLPLSHGATHYRLLPPRTEARATAMNTTTPSDTSQPLVVCIHGAATYSYIWEPLAEKLRLEGVFVLSYDLWGHGHSDAPDAVFDTALYVSQLAQLLGALGLLGSGLGEQGLVLIGVQSGSVVARQFAALHPHLTLGVVALEAEGLGELGDELGWEKMLAQGGAAHSAAVAGVLRHEAPLSSFLARWLPRGLGRPLLGLSLGRELHHWHGRCHHKGRLAATAASAAAEGGDGYSKWVAMARRQFGRPAFTRASLGWLSSVGTPQALIASQELERMSDGSGLRGERLGRLGRHERQARARDGADTAGSDEPAVLRWGRPGQCAEAALREESIEVSATVVRWMGAQRREARARRARAAGAEAEEGAAEGPQLVWLRNALEELGEELEVCAGELEVQRDRAGRAERKLASGGQYGRE